ncbi:MAG: rod shape-determining protein MreC [Verrucomicrobia bacterium]|nr:rod shape-determining protein MreC [Verrucomicrobiota bacterium]
MASVFVRRRRVIVTVLVFVAIFVLLSLKLPISRWARKPVMTVVSPVLRGVEAVGRWFGRVGSAMVGHGLVDEIKGLERRVQALEAERTALEAELESVRATHAQLEAAAAFNVRLLPARVIGREPTGWYDTVVLNVGTGSGVRPGMQVVKGDWYVGRVMEAGPGWSRVMLAYDPRSTVPAGLHRGATYGLVDTSQTRQLVFRYLADAPEVRVGDKIVTWRAATEGEAAAFHFVEGFGIGTVATVGGEEAGWQTALLERPIELESLSEVLVVVSP